MSTSTPPPVRSLPILQAQSFRLDVPLHELLQNSTESPPPAGEEHDPRIPLALPSPVLPRARCWMRLMRGTSQPRQAFEKVQAGLPGFRRKFPVMLLWNAGKV